MRTSTLPTGVASMVVTSRYRALHAVEIGFAAPLRIHDGPPGLNLSIGGNTYTPGILEPGDVDLETANAGGARLRLSNLDNILSTKDLSEGIVGKSLVIYEVYDDSGTWRVEEKFRGRVEGVLWAEDSAEIEADPRSPNTSGVIGRVTDRDRCDYVFKGTSGRCGYSGAETWCDHTYARCSALGNTARWGGVCRLAAYPGQKFQWRVAREAPMSTRSGQIAPTRTPTATQPTNQGASPVRRVIRRT
ncbi:MAG: hypothetical protein ACOY3Y_03695 [Acidobacteriota bacterium]